MRYRARAVQAALIGDFMKFGGLQKLTLLDYPDKVAATVFTVGCNLRCPFCHNFSLVAGNGDKLEVMTEEEILQFLTKRSNVLEGLCLTGGEPLIQQGVEDFLRKVRQLGYKIKLDTNGAFPDRLSALIQQGLVDYVAMDVKNSKDAYANTVGCIVDIKAIEQSVELLKSGEVDYEFRTTVTATFHTQESIEAMAQWLSGAKRLYLQQFVDSGDLIDATVTGVDEQTLKEFCEIAKQYVPNTQVRGI